MQQEEITALFDRMAPSYDKKWGKMSPINSALHLLTDAVLSELPSAANILCIGAGTGAEIVHLALRFPGWRFTAVEPSVSMLNVLRRKAERHGILSRCVLHSGYLDSLPAGDSYDAATAILVSQFIQDRELRTAFFRSIANRLRPGGLLVSADLAGDMESVDCQNLLEVWFKLMSESGIPSDGIEGMRKAYTTDVAVLPTCDVRDMILHGGFESPVQCFQTGMIHAWYAKRSSRLAEQGVVADGHACISAL
jgi:tRNA (cmo5U34)-methyltransferase